MQFRLLARIVGRICEAENWGFLYLTGDSSLEHRAKAIRQFRSDPEIKILVAGLKCGGQGLVLLFLLRFKRLNKPPRLNFPWANRCVSLDLWWNHAVEQQAFGRIFRIGQRKETYMTRIVVRNTVDMRLLAMQLHKLKVCEQAISDGRKPDKPALELEDLVRLFGFLQHDSDGNIIGVEADYDDIDGIDEEAEGSETEHGGSGGPGGSGAGDVEVDEGIEDDGIGPDESMDVDVTMGEDDEPDGSGDVNMLDYEEETGHGEVEAPGEADVEAEEGEGGEWESGD